MISRTLAEKTLLDLGNFEVDRDYSDATRWQCFYVNCPEITIEVHWPNEAAGADSILLRIDLRELQSAVRGEFPTLSSREWEGFKLSALQELERVVSRVNELLQQHPEWCARAASGEEFDPYDSESEMWETEEMRSVRLGQAIYRRAWAERTPSGEPRKTLGRMRNGGGTPLPLQRFFAGSEFGCAL